MMYYYYIKIWNYYFFPFQVESDIILFKITFFFYERIFQDLMEL